MQFKPESRMSLFLIHLKLFAELRKATISFVILSVCLFVWIIRLSLEGIYDICRLSIV